ncbi:hypothetical protein [Amycolatopsis sp. cmx-11-51]
MTASVDGLPDRSSRPVNRTRELTVFGVVTLGSLLDDALGTNLGIHDTLL